MCRLFFILIQVHCFIGSVICIINTDTNLQVLKGFVSVYSCMLLITVITVLFYSTQFESQSLLRRDNYPSSNFSPACLVLSHSLFLHPIDVHCLMCGICRLLSAKVLAPVRSYKKVIVHVFATLLHVLLFFSKIAHRKFSTVTCFFIIETS